MACASSSGRSSNFLPLPRSGLSEGRRRPWRGDAGGGGALLGARRRPRCPRTTRCSSASPTCCARCCTRRRPTCGGRGDRGDAVRRCEGGAALPRPRRLPRGATCSTSSPRAPARSSTAGSNRAPIKAAFGFDAVVGNFASPYTPGSAYVLLHHVFGEVNGKRGQWGHAHRRHGRDHAGDGDANATARGVRSAPTAAVARVEVEDGRARGVALARASVVARAPRRRERESASCCIVQLVAPRRSRRRLPRAHRATIVAAPARSA